jgi:copper chaperone
MGMDHSSNRGHGDVTLLISDMTCGHCVSAVKNALSGVAGVTRVEVDLASGSAVVTGTASAATLADVVRDAGYGVR